MSKVWNASSDAQSAIDISPAEDQILKRTVLIQIHVNRSTWDHLGIHGALWRVNPERSGLYLRHLKLQQDVMTKNL